MPFVRRRASLFFTLCLTAWGLSACGMFEAGIISQQISSTNSPGVGPTPLIHSPPSRMSHLNSLKTSIRGTGVVAYRYKLGVEANLDCTLESGYSVETPVSTLINEALAQDDVQMKLCVIARDVEGRWTPLNSATSFDWYQDSRLRLPFGVGDLFSGALKTGSYLILGQSGMGIWIYDISSPTNPQLVGNHQTEGLVQEFVLFGQTLYVATDAPSIDVLDLTDKTKIRRLGSVTPASLPYSLALTGSHLLVGCNNHLEVYDLSSPAAPNRIGQLGVSRIYDLKAQGNFVYAAGWSRELRIYDITNPTAPVLSGQSASFSTTRAVAVSGNTAYVALEAGTVLRTLDVTNPAAPSPVHTYNTPAAPRDLIVSGGMLHANLRTSALILDLSTPTAPALISQTATNVGGYYAAASFVESSTYYVSMGNVVQIWNLANPASPALTHEIKTLGFDWAATVWAEEDDSYIYVGDNDGLKIVNLQDRLLPRIEGSLATVLASEDLKKIGQVIYGIGTGLFVADVAQKDAPSLLTHWNNATSYTGLEINGTTAYLLTSNSVQVVDLSNPSSPNQIGSLAVGGSNSGLSLEGTFLYIISNTGLHIVDVNNPTAPQLLSSTNNWTSCEQISVQSGIASMACDSMIFVDVRNPLNPTEIADEPGGAALTTTCDCAYGVETRGDFAFFAEWDALSIFDLSNPMQPTLVSWFDIPSTSDASMWRVWVSPTTTYVADGYRGLRYFRTSDPAHLQQK